jgi:heme/copper-type cytochrome/quinol oxidase subunit 2
LKRLQQNRGAAVNGEPSVDSQRMTRNARIGVLLGAVVVAVVAFLLLKPGDDKADPTTTVATVAATTTTPAGTVVVTTETVAKPKPKPDPGPLLTADEVTDITVDGGDTVRFRARSDVDEEIHVHGYDLSFDAPAGKTVKVAFKAKIEGRFEIEFEHSGTQIAELSVEP